MTIRTMCVNQWIILARVYTEFHEKDFQECRCQYNDRVAINHAGIFSISEMNCHLHPFDTVASSRHSALKSLETGRGQLFGPVCEKQSRPALHE